MNAERFRRTALALPEAIEGSHMGQADFRVGGRIFATLALESEGYGVLILTPDQQAEWIDAEPEVFTPVPGGWGRSGSTRVRLKSVTQKTLDLVMRIAWTRRAPKRLLHDAPDAE